VPLLGGEETYIVDDLLPTLSPGAARVSAIGASIGGVTGRLAGRIDRLSDHAFGYLSFVPGGLLMALFVLPPIVAVVAMSFLRIELLKDDTIRFVGLDNYLVRMPRDSAFLDAIPRTVFLAAGVVVLTIPLALACALLLNRAFRFSALVGIAVLLPWAVAPVVTGLYWKFIFHTQFGLMTALANAVGLADGPVKWLEQSTSAMAVAVMATAWRTVPLMALLLLGALRTIPEAQYRAARMDGASGWAAFRYITLPAIAPTLLVVSVLTVILSLQSIDVLFTLTGGGPGTSTTVISYYVYKNTIGQLSFGYSSAVAVVLFLIIAACSALLLLPRLRRGVRPTVSDEEADLLRPVPLRSTAGAARLLSAAPPDTVRSSRPRIPGADRIRRTLLVIGAAVLLVWLIGPIAWILLTSVHGEAAMTQLPPALGSDFRLSNYTDLLSDPRWQGSIVVSLSVVTLVTLITLLVSALAAYPLARFRIPGARLALGLLVFVQMVPAIVVVIPVLLTFRWFLPGLKDTVAALVIVNVAFWIPLVVWLLKNVFEQVPRALESAARIDGCGRLGTLFRVLLPAAWPGIAATAILLLVGTWNEFLFAVILGDTNAVTVTRRIGFIQSLVGITGPPPFTQIAAGGVVAFVPCLVLVILFYRRLMAGLSQGYVKG
jgi:multiple sugar transport system permease protein